MSGLADNGDLTRVRRLASADHGLAVIVTYRSDGTAHCSVVNAGVMDHPLSHSPVVAFGTPGSALKLRHLRSRPRATAVFRSGWEWVAVEGAVSLAGPDDPLPGLSTSIPQLLRDVFTAAGGTHDNWDEYDRVMAEERRTAVFIEMERVYPQGGR